MLPSGMSPQGHRGRRAFHHLYHSTHHGRHAHHSHNLPSSPVLSIISSLITPSPRFFYPFLVIALLVVIGLASLTHFTHALIPLSRFRFARSAADSTIDGAAASDSQQQQGAASDPLSPFPFAPLTNLILVAGHSVYTSPSCAPLDADPSWHLEPYQLNSGAASSFVEHIRLGVSAAAEDSSALLLFSGGETRRDAGPRSEAQSYWNAAEKLSWFGHTEVRGRALTEEYARDSFENLLFSVCRFRQLTGAYPDNITVVSYDFKKFRFSQMHRGALRFPSHRFSFLGSPIAQSARESAAKGEARTLAAFEKEPYGCGGALGQKRRLRDPFVRVVPYPSGCKEIAALFTTCSSQLFSGRLPWGVVGKGKYRRGFSG
ncbi:unnamed protein product [Closterium sp. NIES-54]